MSRRTQSAAALKTAPESPPALTPAWRADAGAHRRELAVLLAVVAFTYLSITRGLVDGNSWARIGLTFAIVDRGELNIDPVVMARNTNDWARSSGHFYSNKAPGPALLAVPLYFAQSVIQRALGVAADDPRARDVAMYVANVQVSILPTLLAMLLLWTVLTQRLNAPPWLAFVMTGTWAVSSMALPYSILLFGHQSAAAFFCIGMCLSLLELDRASGPRPRRIFLAGLAMGMAVLSDYLAAALVALWTVWLLWRERRALKPWILGGAIPGLVMLAYNAACFGSPFTTAYSLAVLNPRFVPIAGWEAPSLSRLVDITVRPWRGLFYCTPAFAFILLGFERVREEAKQAPELNVAALGVVLYFGLLSAFPSAFGGFCVGPRYFTAAIPLALLVMLPAARRFPWLFAALSAIGAVMMIVASITDPLPNERIQDPFREYLFPMLSSGPGPMKNVFTNLLGFSLTGALWAYLLLWAGAAGWLWFRLRGRDLRR